MKLPHGLHLGYCTNIHRGETWEETFAGLREHTLRVRDAVASGQPYGIGLRLSAEAARTLARPQERDRFREWLEREDAYVFTINGFPFGKFHGARVKEQVYAPDWSTPERLDYTCRLFDLLSDLAPPGMAASVSTLPGSFKEFVADESHLQAILENLLRCQEHIERLRAETGRDLHLGLEPEPLGLFETTEETIRFFDRLSGLARHREAFLEAVGVNYDTCHLAVEFEDANRSLRRLRDAGIRISKLHLSSALSLDPGPSERQRLAAFQEPVYLHQVVARSEEGTLRRYRDLDVALEAANREAEPPWEEWRVHFHIPLHTPPEPPFRDTRDHLQSALDALQADPSLCQHLEMETYTWEVLPEELRSGDVVDQLTREYEWTLQELRSRNLA